MRTPSCLRLASVLAVAGAAVLATVQPASAGLIDGSLNNLHAADNSNILGLMLNSSISPDANNNANSRVSGRSRALHLSNADTVLDRCEVTLTATDPDGASGTTTVAVAPEGRSTTEIRITDQVPGTHWHAGDVDHFAGQLVCYDARTGATVGMIAIDEDLTAA